MTPFEKKLPSGADTGFPVLTMTDVFMFSVENICDYCIAFD